MAQALPAVYYIVAAATAATATIAQGHASKQQAEASARESENAAKTASNNALLAQRDANLQKDQIETERRKALAAGVVSAGASGIELSGSFSDSQFDTAMSYERHIADTQYKADMEAYNYRNQAGSLMASAANSRVAGKTAWRVSLISGVSQLAQGAAQSKLSMAQSQKSEAIGMASLSGSWKGLPYRPTSSTRYTGAYPRF